MQPREGDVFYGVYTFNENLSVNLESTIPFYKALNLVVGIYVVSRSTIECFYGKPVCGFIQGWPLRLAKNQLTEKYVIYVSDDLSHYDRLITIGHELIHIILDTQGFPFDSQETAEDWIDEIAKRFFQRNPDFLEWVYRQEVRITD